MSEPIKKKRGRKPKNTYVFNTPSSQPPIDETKTDEENIILHLPITLNDINQTPSINSYFIKQEIEPTIKHVTHQCSDQNSIHEPIVIEKKSKEFPKEFPKEFSKEFPKEFSKEFSPNELNYSENNRNANKIIIHHINISPHTKCWWCHNIFSSPPIQLPDDYYNNTFFCNGHFCSYNCAKSHNLNINDNLTWKRCSLLNLLYYQTYSEYKEIIPAPSWLILEEYGGTMSINEFRNNFIFNSKEYTLLHPPLISRQMQIEESYKINSIQSVPINNLNKLYMDIDMDLQLRRNKPIVNSQMNLENTMGLTKLSRRK